MARSSRKQRYQQRWTQEDWNGLTGGPKPEPVEVKVDDTEWLDSMEPGEIPEDALTPPEHDPWCECRDCLDANPRPQLWLPTRDVVLRG